MHRRRHGTIQGRLPLALELLFGFRLRLQYRELDVQSFRALAPTPCGQHCPEDEPQQEGERDH